MYSIESFLVQYCRTSTFYYPHCVIFNLLIRLCFTDRELVLGNHNLCQADIVHDNWHAIGHALYISNRFLKLNSMPDLPNQFFSSMLKIKIIYFWIIPVVSVVVFNKGPIIQEYLPNKHLLGHKTSSWVYFTFFQIIRHLKTAKSMLRTIHIVKCKGICATNRATQNVSFFACDECNYSGLHVLL